ncbi:MAG: alkaline phosphatase family protein [Caldilineaceae bacterium]|nr:alkaline phosphatase family protein [Caldilineaceae bacterium]
MKTLRRPNYGHGCFADLPGLIQACLTDQPAPTGLAGLPASLLRQYDAVIVLLADAFGWQHVAPRLAHQPVFQQLADGGVITQWTSQFPSTTAAHVTCIHSGLTPSQSGVFEWEYYDPAVDATMTPLLFSYGGSGQRDELKALDLQPAQIYPTQSLHQQLRANGVTTYVYQHREYTPSTYTDWICRGAQMRPYLTLPEALYNLRQEAQHTPKPAYFFLYYDRIDALAHLYGPESPQVAAEIESFLYALEQLFLRPAQRTLHNTLFILTADHGQMTVDPAQTVFINVEQRFAGLERFLRRNRQGRLIGPGGSARDLFLYLQDDLLSEAENFFAERLAGVADVYLTQPLIDQGYFGPVPPSPAFLSRVGNLLILPHAGQTVWWYEEGRYGMRYRGMHGGLSPAELEIPVGLYAF